MTIGEKIKALRKKNDLTQEKLADFLCVSYQAVSKWETGVSSPDLSLIAPLTKLFNVSADELLCLNETEPDARYTELEAAYEETFKTNDLAQRQKICETAVLEYPGDMKFLCNLAWVVSNRSFEHEDQDAYIGEQEKAIKLFNAVIKNCGNDELRNNAIHGIVQLLSWRGRRSEAKKYAEMLPKQTFDNRDEIWKYCLDGEEMIKYKQERLESKFSSVLWDLLLMPHADFSDTIDVLVRVMIPDGNYLGFNHYLFDAKQNRVNSEMKKAANADFDIVMKLLGEMNIHAAEYDEIAYINKGVHKYTTSVFDRIYKDTREWIGSEGSTMIEDFCKYLMDIQFDPIREREDFKALYKYKNSSNISPVRKMADDNF